MMLGIAIVIALMVVAILAGSWAALSVYRLSDPGE